MIIKDVMGIRMVLYSLYSCWFGLEKDSYQLLFEIHLAIEFFPFGLVFTPPSKLFFLVTLSIIKSIGIWKDLNPNL